MREQNAPAVPEYWWKLSEPSVVSAVKSGASSPSCNAMAVLRCRDLGSVLVFAPGEGKLDPRSIRGACPCGWPPDVV